LESDGFGSFREKERRGSIFCSSKNRKKKRKRGVTKGCRERREEGALSAHHVSVPVAKAAEGRERGRLSFITKKKDRLQALGGRKGT